MEKLRRKIEQFRPKKLTEPPHTTPPGELEAVDKALGFPGVLLSSSKRAPHGREDHTIYWNACVFNDRFQQVWYGDLDVTACADDLQSLADLIGTIYVTPEMPWRFEGFKETSKDTRQRERVIEFNAS